MDNYISFIRYIFQVQRICIKRTHFFVKHIEVLECGDTRANAYCHFYKMFSYRLGLLCKFWTLRF